jgi:hypothetical protein
MEAVWQLCPEPEILFFTTMMMGGREFFRVSVWMTWFSHFREQLSLRQSTTVTELFGDRQAAADCKSVKIEFTCRTPAIYCSKGHAPKNFSRISLPPLPYRSER